MDHIECEFTDDPACLLVTFKDNPHNNICIPCKFMVKVSKYYPHNSPIVTCLDEHLSAPFIDANGEIQHMYLQNGWSAIGTLRTLLDIIQSLRPYFVQVQYNDTMVRTPQAKADVSRGNMEQSPNGLSMEL